MLRFVEMDESVTYSAQMEQTCGPVIVINKFNVAPEHVEAFLTAWAGTASVMKRQPGYISTQLHKGVGGSCTVTSPHLFQKIAVPGVRPA